MEIKIVQSTKKSDECSGFKTSIFEGYNITHEWIYYKDRTAFLNIFSSRTNANDIDNDTYVLGIPSEMWTSEEETDKCKDTCFVLITFNKLNNSKADSFIVTKDSTVYITNDGRTIDTFNC